MDTSLILVVVLIAAALYCFIKLLAAPMKLLWKFVLNVASGFLILLLCEFVLGFFDISLGITVFNCLVAGVCGIPGVVVLILLKILL